jgi:hypothetical protein
MKIKTRHLVEKEHEIELPYYSKDSAHHYKVLTEKLAISITYINHEYFGISYSDTWVSSALEAEKCTEQEFNEAFKKVQTLLNNKL